MFNSLRTSASSVDNSTFAGSLKPNSSWTLDGGEGALWRGSTIRSRLFSESSVSPLVWVGGLVTATSMLFWRAGRAAVVEIFVVVTWNEMLGVMP